MKHKHYDMICAKAENMDLVLFHCGIGGWYEYGKDGEYSPFCQDEKYFLCLPQHKEACLHWLNGGDVQIAHGKEDFFWNWSRPSREWRPHVSFMIDSVRFRIKPRKEKRWIGVYGNHVTESHYKSEEVCKLFVLDDASYSAFSREKWQFIEIEVEV